MTSPTLETSRSATGPRPAGRWTALGRTGREWFPAAFFMGGFIWDTIALGRGFKEWDLWLLLGYTIVSTVVLALIGRGMRPKREEWFNWVLQFCFGGTFASLTVLYFISASSWPSLLFIGIVCVLLVANEYLEKRYGELTVSLTMYSVATIMYLNFVFPVLFRSIRPVWFYVSTAAGLLLAYGVRRIARASVRFAPSVVVAIVLGAMFLLNWVPPVPLVKRSMVICRELVRSGPGHEAKIEAPPFWQFWARTDRTVHRRPGEKVFCYSSIFCPPGITTEVVHQWYYADPRKGWVKDVRIPVTIRGGREEGFRISSWKQNLPAGTWYVATETTSGQVIAGMRFYVEDASPDARLAFKTIRLR